MKSIKVGIVKNARREMYRIEARVGKSWMLGLNVYYSLDEAEARKVKMESVGIKVRIVETDW